MTNTPEQLNNGHEAGIESQKTAAEQLEKLSRTLERTGEHSPESGEKSAEKARIEALESAISVESGGKEKAVNNHKPSPAVRRGSISKSQKDASYKRTMKHVQTELSPGSRAFSKVIHIKAVEKASDAIGSTIARPDAMLAGAVSAFILTLGLYVMAKTLGYQLSGFETIGAFIIGWVCGITYDYFRLIITGKKS
ncbi:hypothetical protein H7X69_01710 [Candidatus Saccharibacteria bacterium]|nr:hypothetical protein [Candidatus Saccharibacteria bacterium]